MSSHCQTNPLTPLFLFKVTSMLQTYQEGGRLPIWQNIVETNIMISTHSASLIAEALVKGFEFDTQLAWEAIVKV